MQELGNWNERTGASQRLGCKALAGFVGVLLTLTSGSAFADEFTFRRVGVPRDGSDRITVQIGVDASADGSSSTGRPELLRARDEPEPAMPEGRAAAHAAGVEWFWDGVSPRLADAGPGRLEEALDVIADAVAGEIVPPQRQALQDLEDLYGADILRLTTGTRVPPALVLAVMAVESAGRSDAVSHARAAGLMQLMPATAARFGVQDRLEPRESIRGGVAYLDWLLNHFEEDPILALAAYNAGEGAVENNDGVPPYPETRAYVPKVLATWAVARDLCQGSQDSADRHCELMVAGL